MRLGLYDTDYTALAKKAYRGVVNRFMVSDGKGGVHLVHSCKSAGLGGSQHRDGSAAYYLMGSDTKPTSTSGSDFYTEGKVLGGFILAAIEYERLQEKEGAVSAVRPLQTQFSASETLYSLGGRRLAQKPLQGLYIAVPDAKGEVRLAK